MATEEANLDVSGSAQTGASPDAASSSDATSTAIPATESSQAGVTPQPSDPTQTQEPIDPLKGVPTAAEVAEMQTVSKEAFLSLRNEYDKVKPQFTEISAKYQPFEQFTQTPEELQSVVKLSESLNKYSPDPVTGALRPDPSEFVAQISTEDPVRADHLTSALIWGQTKHPGTGQPVTRAELVLQVMANDPELRAHALRTLRGVEPSAVPAPSWYPTQTELDKLDDPDNPTAEGRALQERYKKLPYETRSELQLASPEYVISELRRMQSTEQTERLNQQLMSEKTERIQREEREAEQAAQTAGDSYVESGFREGLTKLANHIYETYKPTDDPVTNKREGGLVTLAVVSLSHPDTRWAGEQILKEMGVNPQDLEPLNQARESYASAGRQFAYLTHKKQRVTGEDPVRAQQRLLVQGQNLATKIIKGRSAYFTGAAKAHNDNLDQTERARIPIGGSPANTGAASGNRYLQAGKRTESEIYGS